MKGYLQRLAMQAIRPQAGIHPMVGSLYGHSEFANWGSDTSSEVFAPEHERATRKTLPEKYGTQEPLTESAAHAEREEFRNVNKTESRGEMQEAAPVNLAFKPLIGAPNTVAFPSASTERTQNEPAARRAVARHAVDRESDAAKSYTPLLPREEKTVYVTRTTPKQEPPTRAAADGRESAPIQIHIGRIEMTAVPEAQRPAAGRARKSLDLGAYLKRRDGRTG